MSTSDPVGRPSSKRADPQQPRPDRVEACTASVARSATLAVATTVAVLCLVLLLALLR